MKEPKKGKTSSSRLHEMLSVFRRYHVLKGITPKKLREMLEELGPTFIKIGQILSMRADMLPKEYCSELSQLRSRVKPLPFETICKAVEQEYGDDWQTYFQSIETAPLGSASIAQVHAAVLKNGRRVIVKVQRPRIYETMREDISILKRAVKLLNLSKRLGNVVDLTAVLQEIWTVAQQEMNFLLEADHMEEFARKNSDIRYVSSPCVIRSLTTDKILVMEYIKGTPIDQTNALQSQGYDLNEIGRKLAQNYVKQVLDDAFFHADPHPGNIWINGGKIVWLDFGMMGRITARDKQLFRAAVNAIVNQDVYELKNAFLSIGVVHGKIDHAALYTDMDTMLLRYGNMELGNMNLAEAFGEFMEIAHRYHISMPQGVTMLARGMMTIEGVLSLCAPEINLMEILASHFSGDILQEIDWETELKKAGKTLYALLNRSAVVPTQLADVLKMAVKGQAKINVELTGSEKPIEQLGKITDRLAAGLIMAALIIGASLLCISDMSPRLWGIPFISVIGYAVSAVIGLCLLFGYLWRRKKEK